MLFFKYLNLKLLLFFFVLINFPYANAQELERIINQKIDITINSNGSLSIIEETTVFANQEQIKRGIIKDLLTNKLNGNYKSQNYQVKSAKINDQPTQFFVENNADFQSIRIGDPNTLLSPGVYKFTLEYEAFNSLGFFENHDELYWNITGNNSAFRIDNVSGTIRYPKYIDPGLVRTKGYLGYLGSNQEFTNLFKSNNEINFSYNQSLLPGQGITVVVGFPKGIFPADQPVTFTTTEPALVFISLVFLNLLALGVFFYRRNRENRESDFLINNATVNFEIPKTLLPSEARYIFQQRYDQECLGVEVLNLAINKNIKITGDTSDNENLNTFIPKYNLELLVSKENFSGLQKNIIENLFSNKNKIDTTNTTDMGLLQTANLILKNEIFAKKYLDQGLGLSPLVKYLPYIIFFGILLIFAQNNDINMGIFLLGGITILAISRLIILALKKMGEIGAFNKILYFGITIIGIFSLVITAIALTLENNFWYLLLFLTSLIPFFIAEYQSPKYKLTQEGLEKMILIEGFRKFALSQENYISSIQKDLPEKFNMYEKYLPYAIALNVDTEWSKKFKDAIDFAATQPDLDTDLDYAYIRRPSFVVRMIRRNDEIIYQKAMQSAARGISSSGFSSRGFSGGGGGSRGTRGW